MKTNTVIANTKKGSRVYIQGILEAMPHVSTYDVTYADNCIVIHFTELGKRKLCMDKGGVIDLESKKVKKWAQDSTSATIRVLNDSNILIERQL